MIASQWTAEQLPDLAGKTIVVTGANSGLGFESTKAFAGNGGTVVMACRSLDRGKSAATEIRETVPDAALDVRECDLADLDSVEAFADGVRADYDDLHVLCNNAGVMAIPRQETTDGFEMQLGVNHLGHFALTAHLLPMVVATPGETRIVTQSSGAHEMGDVDFDDLHREQSYRKWEAYGQSKLANLLFAYELQRRLDDHRISDTKSVACHPGYAATNLQFRGPDTMGSTLLKPFWALANRVLAQSARMGALPLLYAATATDVTGGDYIGPGGFMEMRGYPERTQSNTNSRDPERARRLWEESEKLAGVDYAFDALAAVPADD